MFVTDHILVPTNVWNVKGLFMQFMEKFPLAMRKDMEVLSFARLVMVKMVQVLLIHTNYLKLFLHKHNSYFQDMYFICHLLQFKILSPFL